MYQVLYYCITVPSFIIIQKVPHYSTLYYTTVQSTLYTILMYKMPHCCIKYHTTVPSNIEMYQIHYYLNKYSTTLPSATVLYHTTNSTTMLYQVIYHCILYHTTTPSTTLLYLVPYYCTKYNLHNTTVQSTILSAYCTQHGHSYQNFTILWVSKFHWTDDSSGIHGHQTFTQGFIVPASWQAANMT